MIGNWEEEEYCRSYRAALGGGVRRFDALVIPTALDSAKRACCNAAVRLMHGSRFKRQRAAATFASGRFRIFRIGAFFRERKRICVAIEQISILLSSFSCIYHKAVTALSGPGRRGMVRGCALVYSGQGQHQTSGASDDDDPLSRGGHFVRGR
ncbi:hypothetical protein D4A92_07015 [Rhizobium rosettiformans]|uniref:Uncharacterized protein n=1 Tax=Rhizobium rosettiformans TaxID=1368430 RepID=A0ABX7ES98_9HYPH|nr:hypothetical protein D4A92_07015 [Rhizobium rosettiformans]